MVIWPPEQSPESCSWEAATDSDIDIPQLANAFAVVKSKLAQRIGNTRHVALLPYDGPAPPVPNLERDLVIQDIWPQHGVPVDMRAMIPPGYLAQRYDDAVWGSSPVALFPKQVLAKARAALAQEMYIEELRTLLVAPDHIEQRYFQDPEIEKRAQAHRGDLIPIGQVLRQLRHRETQLQVVLGLELLPSAPDIEPVLDHHFDRLCIWQAVGTDTDSLNEFCAVVVLPFFKSRCPQKTKQFIKRSRGTLKTRTRKPLKDMTGSVALPSGGGGLLKALQITGSNLTPKPLPDPPSDPKPIPTLRPSAAVRSASHPLYTMASRQNTVEVRFKRSRRHGPGSQATQAPSGSAASGPLAPSASIATTTLGPPPQSPPPLPAHPSLPLPASVNDKKVQATPKKERTKFLESLNQPIPIDFDTIESTDSDE